MGLFNLVENFFFISLGITFVLIMLLVFHFKQRLTALESKNEDIMSGLRNILGILSSHTKTLAKASHEPPSYQQMNPQLHSFSQTHISNPLPTNAGISMSISPKIVVSDDEESDTETDSSENEEYTATENMLDAVDSDMDSSDTEDENILLSKSDIDNALPVSELVVDDILDDLVFDNIAPSANSNLEEIVEITNNLHIYTNKLPEETAVISDNYHALDVKEDTINNEESAIVSDLKVNNVEDISTKKSEDVLVETNQLQEEIKDYKKMNINQLKALVITKGLFVDTSKMKKAEIVSLLSSV